MNFTQGLIFLVSLFNSGTAYETVYSKCVDDPYYEDIFIDLEMYKMYSTRFHKTRKYSGF